MGSGFYRPRDGTRQNVLDETFWSARGRGGVDVLYAKYTRQGGLVAN